MGEKKDVENYWVSFFRSVNNNDKIKYEILSNIKRRTILIFELNDFL